MPAQWSEGNSEAGYIFAGCGRFAVAAAYTRGRQWVQATHVWLAGWAVVNPLRHGHCPSLCCASLPRWWMMAIMPPVRCSCRQL
jgi:hypothetical protein